MTPAARDLFKPDAVACGAAAAIVAVLVFKATSTLDPLPGWSGDPTLVAAPILGLTPAPSIIADLILCLASAVAIGLGISRVASGRRIIAIALGLIVLFLASSLPHIAAARHDPHSALTLSAWLAAFAAGLSACFLRAFPRARAILASGAVGLLAAFFARALVQYFIEQPAAYEAFKATKSAFLAAQGWPEGSPNALAYERRVSQQEASAWFGMANVLASYGAAFAACFATWTIGSLTDRTHPASTRARTTLIACTLASIALVAMAGSKGGYAALALGLLIACLAAWRSLRAQASSGLQRASLVIGPALIALALAAIILRGAIGERIHELSLLFRWHYLVGAWRTFLENPFFGVSPTGFKDAYLRLKPPTSPEDVASPHNVLFDLITGLGIAGIAWSLTALLAAAVAGRTLLAPRSALDPVQPREREPLAATPGARPTFLALAAGTLGAAWLESEAVTPEAALVRIIAILGGMSVAGLALRTFERSPRTFSAGLAAGALIALVHAQIELTWALITSAPLLAVLVGLGASDSHRDAQPSPIFSRLSFSVAALPGLAVATLIALMLPSVVTWERSLRRAYADVAPLASFNDRLQALAAATRNRDPVARELAAALASELLPPAQANASFAFNDLTAAYSKSRLDRMSAALDVLAPAQRLATHDIETQRAISTLALRLALEHNQASTSADASAATARAVRVAYEAATANPRSATAASWIATVCRTLAQTRETHIQFVAELGPYPAAEIRYLLQAAALAPYEPSHAAWLAEAYAAQGDQAEAAKWAKEAIRRDALLYLDPIRQFEPARRARMESLAKGTSKASSPLSP